MTNENILTIARYAEGDMDEAELTAFEARLKAEPELQAQLEEYHNLHNTLKQEIAPSARQQAVAQTLQGYNRQYFQSEAKVVSLKPYIKWLSGVAAAIFVAMFIWAPWKGSLYEQFSGEHIPVAERSSGELDNFTKGAQAYNVKDFAKAQEYFYAVSQAQPSNVRNTYYLGQTYIQTGKVEEGRLLLNTVYSGTSVYRYDAAYAVALSYLKEENKAKCKEWLNKIPEASSKFEKAQKLLKAL